MFTLQAEHGRTQDRMFEALSQREEQQSVKQQDSELAAADMERAQQHIRCYLLLPILLSGQLSWLSDMHAIHCRANPTTFLRASCMLRSHSTAKQSKVAKHATR